MKPSEDDALDAYEPEGEWNIDGTGIEATDLLAEEAARVLFALLVFIHAPSWWVRKSESAVVDGRGPLSCQANCGKCCDEPGGIVYLSSASMPSVWPTMPVFQSKHGSSGTLGKPTTVAMF